MSNTHDDGQAARTVKPDAPTKQKNIRITLEGPEYLTFHELVGRLVFPQKMTERQTDEEVVKLALRHLYGMVADRVHDGDTFVPVGLLEPSEGGGDDVRQRREAKATDSPQVIQGGA
ncbi:MAG: hypothetical protein KKG92_05840 [Gammaproteobacteria bacterium]|nr:hypothetical protein [Gammaproteobacteria bacterium]